MSVRETITTTTTGPAQGEGTVENQQPSELQAKTTKATGSYWGSIGYGLSATYSLLGTAATYIPGASYVLPVTTSENGVEGKEKDTDDEIEVVDEKVLLEQVEQGLSAFNNSEIDGMIANLFLGDEITPETLAEQTSFSLEQVQRVHDSLVKEGVVVDSRTGAITNHAAVESIKEYLSAIGIKDLAVSYSQGAIRENKLVQPPTVHSKMRIEEHTKKIALYTARADSAYKEITKLFLNDEISIIMVKYTSRFSMEGRLAPEQLELLCQAVRYDRDQMRNSMDRVARLDKLLEELEPKRAMLGV